MALPPKFVELSHLSWASLLEVARGEFPDAKVVDVLVDYRHWNQLRMDQIWKQPDAEDALVEFQARPTFVQKIRVVVGLKNQAVLLEHAPLGTVVPKIVQIVGLRVWAAESV